MRALFIANKLSEINPLMDSSLYMIRALCDQNVSCSWTTEEDVFWQEGKVFADVSNVLSAVYRKLPELGESERKHIKDFDFIFIRKNPPFDGRYTRLCWLLIPYEKQIRMVNRPSLLLNYHEKILPLFALADGDLKLGDLIPTCLPASGQKAVEFVKKLSSKKIVIKPWLGYAGHDVTLVDCDDFLKSPSNYIPEGRYFILQPFDESIYEKGDRRVFFIGGKYVGDAVRIPREGSFISNLGQGGSAHSKEMTDQERGVVKRLEGWLTRMRIDFAGADLISGKVNEVNITSPTMIPAFEDLTKQDLAKALVDSILQEKHHT